MVAWRRCLPRRALAPYGVAVLFFALGSAQIGRQDLAAFIARQPAVSERAREHLIGSPVGTLHAALFSLPRPVGTAMPVPERVMLAKFDPTALIEPADALPRDPERWLRQRDGAGSAHVSVNRTRKGDSAIPRIQIEINRAAVASRLGEAPLASAEADELAAAQQFQPFPEYDISLSLELHPTVPAHSEPAGDESAEADAEGEEAQTAFGETRLYFEGVPMTAALARIEPWGSGEAPVLELMPGAPALAKLEEGAPPAAAPQPQSEPVTRAAKGEIPQAPRGPFTAAARLGLTGKARGKAERCLANAVYFEARGESVRGQIAVAQVVLNRALSGYYPRDVCGVVYQGARRHLSCQFTFACDGIPDVVTEPEPWERAQRIAKAALDGKVWLKEVGKATHYHANWVTPYWVRSMRRLHRIGVHSFYRPRRWGDGSDAPTWGKPANAEFAATF